MTFPIYGKIKNSCSKPPTRLHFQRQDTPDPPRESLQTSLCCDYWARFRQRACHSNLSRRPRSRSNVPRGKRWWNYKYWTPARTLRTGRACGFSPVLRWLAVPLPLHSSHQCADICRFFECVVDSFAVTWGTHKVAFACCGSNGF